MKRSHVIVASNMQTTKKTFGGPDDQKTQYITFFPTHMLSKHGKLIFRTLAKGKAENA